MEAFLTPGKTSQLRGILQDIDHGGLRNLWLLSPSFHSAFRSGRIRIQAVGTGVEWSDEDEIESPNATKTKVHVECILSFYFLLFFLFFGDSILIYSLQYIAVTMWPEECTNLVFSDGSPFQGPVHMFDIHTRDPALYPLPSPVLLRVHFRFASALHLFFVEERVSKGWPQPPLGTVPTSMHHSIRLTGIVEQLRWVRQLRECCEKLGIAYPRVCEFCPIWCFLR